MSPAPQLAARRQRGQHRLDARQARRSPSLPSVGRPGDHVHVDRPGQAHDAVDHRAAEQLLPARAVARAEHDLRGVLRPGQLDEGGGDVVARDLAVLAAELLEQLALLGHHSPPTARRPDVRPGVGDDVDADQLALGPLGDAGGPADQVVGAGRAGEGDDDPLAGLPRAGDAVALAVVLQRVVDAVGDPQQRQLAQRRQVAGPEVVAERGVDLLRAVDVAVGEPPAQRLRRHVDELDLVGARARRGRAPSRAGGCR